MTLNEARTKAAFLSRDGGPLAYVYRAKGGGFAAYTGRDDRRDPTDWVGTYSGGRILIGPPEWMEHRA